jgi:Glycosyltransferase family 87
MNLHPHRRRYRLLAIFLLAMTMVHAIVFRQQRGRIFSGYGDFSALYTAGVMVQRGQGHLLYDRKQQWKVQQEFASQVDIRHGPMPFIRPPFEALIFLPLSYFSYPVALAVWSLAKLGLLFLAAWILPREHPFPRIFPFWLEAILSLGFFPVFLDLFQGQDAILLLLLVVVALDRLRDQKDIAAGVWLALGLFKFHLVLPLVIMLVLAGRPRILAGFLPAAAALAGISCAISGIDVLHVYPAYLLELNQSAGVGVVTAQSMPNLRGLLTAWVGTAPYPGPVHWLLLPVAIVAMVFVARLWRSAMKTGFTGLALGYCLALAVALLTSYYAYSYDITLMAVPALLLGGKFLEQFGLDPRTRWILAAALLLLICTPLYWGLILRLDRAYFLSLPMLLLAIGLIRALRLPRPVSA